MIPRSLILLITVFCLSVLASDDYCKIKSSSYSLFNYHTFNIYSETIPYSYTYKTEFSLKNYENIGLRISAHYRPYALKFNTSTIRAEIFINF